MNCLKCGALNNEGSKFCVKCGSALNVSQPVSPSSVSVQSGGIEQENHMVENRMVPPIQPNLATNTVAAPLQNNQVATPTLNNQPVATQPASESLHYFAYMIAFMIKPFQTFKEERNKIGSTKVAMILGVIVTAVLTILNLLNAMISAVYVKHTSWLSGTSYSWEWKNLKDLNYISLILKNFIIYAIIFAAIAGLFYIVGLIIKKKFKFQESLSITVSSILPTIVCSVFATILGFIYAPLAFAVSALGCIYTFTIFHELIGYGLEIEGNKRIYISTICYGIIVCAVLLIFMTVLSSAISSGLTNILGM